MSNKQINYYKLDQVGAATMKESTMAQAVKSIQLAMKGATDDLDKLANIVYTDEIISKFLMSLAKMPVFSKDFAMLFQDNLEVLSILKKLKFFVNLKIRETLYLLMKLCVVVDDENAASEVDIDRFFEVSVDSPKANQMIDLKFKTAIRGDDLFNSDQQDKKSEYLQEFDNLEKVEPHAIYPTSIYRQSDGYTVAAEGSQKIEAVMSTTLTTSIRISSHVLGFRNNLLADIYRPIGRAVIVLDDKLDAVNYTSGLVEHDTNKRVVMGMQCGEVNKRNKMMTIREQLERYFTHHGVEVKFLIKSGNEVDKDIKKVQEILIDLKTIGVNRNEPVLVVGGGVVADIAGFACALFHRNTPYVMLATSIVSGIDAGPSPRTCCDGQGYKNAFGAIHPPVVTLTDRTLWTTMNHGMVRHGIAEIVKMAVAENKPLFELLEKVGPEYLVKTKFGTDLSCLPSDSKLDIDEFNVDCERIVGMAMESYVRAEYGNLWETHQCRPHAYGHTWSPGYELPAGMLHGHAVATCMGFGAYLSWKHCGWFTEEQCTRVCKLINDLELSLWHEIMNDKEIFHASTKKMIEKRGGNLAAPLPRGEIGECGYLNDITDAQLSKYVDEYREFVTSGSFARAGRGVEPLLEDVGLGDTSHDAISHVRAEIAHGLKNVHLNCDHIKGAEEEKKDGEVADGRNESYQDWIKKAQEDRNSDWKMNVGFVKSADTETAITFPQNTLFYDGAEEYAMSQTSIVSTNIQAAAKVTMEEGLFAPCMVGSLESQFLKMFARTAKAKRILDVGTFTGMSAIAFAEGALRHTPTAQIHTLESDAVTAEAAAKIFSMCEPSVSKAIQLHHCDAIEWMRSTASDPNGLSFDIIFIDADKDNYLAYYEYAMGDREGFRPLLSKDGIILADNTLSALVYDDDDSRRTALHLFNQHVKNDARVEQAVMTVREGVSIIIRV